MELTVDRPGFLRELEALQGVVERKNTIPILSNVLLRAENGGVSLTSTDLDLTLHTRVPAEVKAPGSLCAPARKLFDLVRVLADDRLKMKFENHNLVLSAGSGRYKIVSQPAEDFPTLPSVDGKTTMSLPFSLWKKATRKVLYAISSEERRFQLAGAYLKVKGEAGELVATDGHRMALVNFALPASKAKLPETLIPKKAMAELLKMDAGDDASLEITHSDNHVAFRVGERQLIARLLDVKFPDYEKVLGKSQERVVEVAREDLEKSIRRIALFSSERAPGVRFEFAADAMTISSASQEVGEATESIGVAYQGEPVRLSLNPHYLLDFLGEAETEKVVLEVKDENTQCLCRPAAAVADLSRYVYVVMPMRL